MPVRHEVLGPVPIAERPRSERVFRERTPDAVEETLQMHRRRGQEGGEGLERIVDPVPREEGLPVAASPHGARRGGRRREESRQVRGAHEGMVDGEGEHLRVPPPLSLEQKRVQPGRWPEPRRPVGQARHLRNRNGGVARIAHEHDVARAVRHPDGARQQGLVAHAEAGLVPAHAPRAPSDEDADEGPGVTGGRLGHRGRERGAFGRGAIGRVSMNSPRLSMRSFLSCLALLAYACADPAAVEVARPAQGTDVPAPASYSPFALEMSGDAPFRRISFKDVGMSLPEAERGFVYESLAESLSSSLGRRLDAELASHVVHDPALTNPASHLACEGGHIYVDVWSAGEGYGYSLWSGCGEDDRFAHREVAPRDTGDDRVAALLPLAEDMAAQLRSAVASGCFTRHC